jgi:hypothetical protein
LNALNAATWFGNLEAVRLLLKNGAKVDAIDGLGLTALGVAAIWDRKDIAAVLIGSGARGQLRCHDAFFLTTDCGDAVDVGGLWRGGRSGAGEAIAGSRSRSEVPDE